MESALFGGWVGGQVPLVFNDRKAEVDCTPLDLRREPLRHCWFYTSLPGRANRSCLSYFNYSYSHFTKLGQRLFKSPGDTQSWSPAFTEVHENILSYGDSVEIIPTSRSLPGKHASHWAMRLRWRTGDQRGPRPGWLMSQRQTSAWGAEKLQVRRLDSSHLCDLTQRITTGSF